MISLTLVVGFILIFFRLSSFFMVVPVFFPAGTPNIAKVGFCFLITYIFMPLVDITHLGSNITLLMIIIYSVSEVLVGISLGYITRMCFQLIDMAGQFMDFHVGFSMSQMFDPSLEDNTTIIGRIMYWTSIMIFFLIDGHHMLIMSILSTFEKVKLGMFVMNDDFILYIFEVFTEFFNIALKISIPVTLILLFTNIILGLISRSVPQLNVMVLGMPIKIVVGVVSLIIAMPILVNLMVDMFDKLYLVLTNIFGIIPFIFIFADSGGEKSEEATPKKKSDAKKKGQVAKSKELGVAFTLIAATLVFALLGGYIFSQLKDLITVFFKDYLTMDVSYSTLFGIATITVKRILVIFLPIAVPIMIMGIIINYFQTGFILTGEPLKPDLKKLNPISGFKRMFSIKSLVNLIKDLLVVSVVGYVGYKFFMDNYSNLMNFTAVKISAMPSLMSSLAIKLFFTISLVSLIIAVIDFVYQKYQHKKDLRMTKQEIKEEFKQMEGDPQVKGKIKQIQREMAMKRMMQSVPDASVVITNPTHIAVALRYKEGKDNAPMVVAKGADNVAIKIKELARESDVPIIENKSLARLIFSQVDIDREVPQEMYQAIAEILAIVYKLKKKK